MSLPIFIARRSSMVIQAKCYAVTVRSVWANSTRMRCIRSIGFNFGSTLWGGYDFACLGGLADSFAEYLSVRLPRLSHLGMCHVGPCKTAPNR